MQAIRAFLQRKDIEISLRRYGIDALGAMAQGLFCPSWQRWGDMPLL